MLDIIKLLNENPLEYHFEREIYILFKNFSYLIKDKRILDIGTRDGLNLLSLKYYGANEVIGIDIDDSKFKKYELDDTKLIKMDIFDYSDQEKFDIITIFLWNFSLKQYDEIALKLKELIKENGSIIIGFYDDVYKSNYLGYDNTCNVIELFNKHYKYVRIIHKGLQWFIEVK